MNFKMVISLFFGTFIFLLSISFAAESGTAESADCLDAAGLIIIGEVEKVTFAEEE